MNEIIIGGVVATVAILGFLRLNHRDVAAIRERIARLEGAGSRVPDEIDIVRREVLKIHGHTAQILGLLGAKNPANRNPIE